ncbi:MAG TPA: MBL fold metallo-hydrolase [Chitinophagaceae bacterium]|nr:MBL fold metallo-hydrolase [Chitinophagaceae bacterium]
MKISVLKKFYSCSALLGLALALGFTAFKRPEDNNRGWCGKPPRAGLEKLKEIKTSRPWFRVFDVGNNTYAIDEPYNWEETISYLIIGQQQALLFDTGMGLDSIELVIQQLTQLPVLVINSHTHNDHIGRNFAFAHILAMNTAYTHINAANGYTHSQVQAEVKPESFCLQRLPGTDTAAYFTRPFKVTQFINGGYKIALGGRTIQVVATPGHTPDAICLYDEKAGYLWCGDSFYEGPIFLFADSTNLPAYRTSIHIIAQLAGRCKYVLPAHNLPIVKPSLVIKAAADFDEILQGKKQGIMQADSTLLYDCGPFSYKIGSRYMRQLPQTAR